MKIFKLVFAAALIWAASAFAVTDCRSSGIAASIASIVCDSVAQFKDGSATVSAKSLTAREGAIFGAAAGNVSAFIPQAQYTNFNVNGNSFTDAPWVTYPAILAATARATLINQGDGSGISIADPYAIGRIVANTTRRGSTYLIDLIANDLGFNDSLVDYGKILAAGAGWYIVPDDLKRKQETATYSGTWPLDSLYGVKFRKTTTAGNYLTITTDRPSTSVFIGTILNYINDGKFLVTVDGTPRDTIDSHMFVNHHSVGSAPGGYIITGLSDSIHTIRLTAVGSGSEWRFAWSYGGGPRYPLGVPVFVMNYNSFGVDRSSGTAKAGWAKFSHVQDSVVSAGRQKLSPLFLTQARW